MSNYHDTFDHLGNPVARRVRFVWLRRISESAQAEGVFVIAGCVVSLALVIVWMSGVTL